MNFEIDTLVHYYELLLQRLEDLEGQMQQVRDGSIVTHISEAIHWKATTKTLTGGTDYTADGAWTDLSLKAWTSNKAKYVIFILDHTSNCTANDLLGLRKNGETPTTYPKLTAQVNSQPIRSMVTCAIDSGQVIEYYATDASDTLIDILGYIE